MNDLQTHRGPDGEGVWLHDREHVGFGHRRLSVIDLTTGNQPMADEQGNWITYNGEIYNYLELRDELGAGSFRTTSDTEVILKAYQKWGAQCVDHLRGMFSFALWDEKAGSLFCARDRFGIKPFYYTVVGDVLYFASEIKALLPFLPAIETDDEGLKDYLAFQFCLAGKTLFRGVKELLPGHMMQVRDGIQIHRYWEVYYDVDFGLQEEACIEEIRALLSDSVRYHLRSDVPVGAYLSGGLDSSTVASLAAGQQEGAFHVFTGRFTEGPEYDESHYARAVADDSGLDLHVLDIQAGDFTDHIQSVIYHLDYPVAGPGSFPQYMVSRMASEHLKVVLGGQGGDEIFGGYTRYLIAYFEQCIKAAIDGTMHDGNFVVTYESIIPNLSAMRNYKPLLKQFWQKGLFEDMDKRYFHLINRAATLKDEIRWELLRDYSAFDTFQAIFYGNNVGKESYFDLMTHFDFKTLLPALLQVEDRVSMAHGLESRVPLLDHTIVEYAARIPANVKFQNGTMKHVFQESVRPYLPAEVSNRKDKMGFPTPLTEWVQGDLKDFVRDIFSSEAARSRPYVHHDKVLASTDQEGKFGRKLWGLLSLEIWQQEFHDQHTKYKSLLDKKENAS